MIKNTTFTFVVGSATFENGAEPWGEGFRWAKEESARTGNRIFRIKSRSEYEDVVHLWFPNGGVFLDTAILTKKEMETL